MQRWIISEAYLLGLVPNGRRYVSMGHIPVISAAFASLAQRLSVFRDNLIMSYDTGGRELETGYTIW